MFVTAVCVLFLIKLRWPKKKSIYDLIFESFLLVFLHPNYFFLQRVAIKKEKKNIRESILQFTRKIFCDTELLHCKSYEIFACKAFKWNDCCIIIYKGV